MTQFQTRDRITLAKIIYSLYYHLIVELLLYTNLGIYFVKQKYPFY